jgi:hypothetical protein
LEQKGWVRPPGTFHLEAVEYVPFPAPPNLGFARFNISREGINLTLGIFPHPGESENGTIVVKQKESI